MQTFPLRPALSESYDGPMFTQEHLLRLFTKAPGAFWRFDVDVSLEAAAKMARFAEMAGVRGTFYVMSTSEFYNPFSPAGAQAIGAIHEAGHRIGLHCDYRPAPGPMIPFGSELIEEHAAVWPEVQRQRRLLLNAYPEIVDPRLVSFHMPAGAVLWSAFKEFENAYAPDWLGRYLSDSRREWSDEKEARVADDMQIALHAEHWF